MTTMTPPEVKECKSCGARIYWARTFPHPADPGPGKSMPVDAAPVENGTVELYRRKGSRTVYLRVLNRAQAEAHTMAAIERGEGPRLRTSHFATCEHAKSHRKSPR